MGSFVKKYDIARAYLRLLVAIAGPFSFPSIFGVDVGNLRGDAPDGLRFSGLLPFSGRPKEAGYIFHSAAYHHIYDHMRGYRIHFKLYVVLAVLRFSSSLMQI